MTKLTTKKTFKIKFWFSDGEAIRLGRADSEFPRNFESPCTQNFYENVYVLNMHPGWIVINPDTLEILEKNTEGHVSIRIIEEIIE